MSVQKGGVEGRAREFDSGPGQSLATSPLEVILDNSGLLALCPNHLHTVSLERYEAQLLANTRSVGAVIAALCYLQWPQTERLISIMSDVISDHLSSCDFRPQEGYAFNVLDAIHNKVPIDA
ncbi:hypothetical protein RRG08_007119 [Elysia crispata]|uniref:Uncharacterized protein n=1 Tax=Elysia crispata TaxID=231223 RepID=A0AAE1CUE9_9GAST|nr:hypothetical protein RRG08_007119 [Elysia crispata]